MEYRHLRSFMAVAEELHFGRAARRLGLSQPPLSRQIREIEDEIGVELFRRNKRHVNLTAAGAAFLEEANRAILQRESAIKTAQLVAAGQVGRLSIGLVDAATIGGLLPEALRVFREKHDKVVVDLTELPSRDQLVALRERRIDVGLVHIVPNALEPTLAHERVVPDPLVIVLPSRHRLAARPRFRLADLSGDVLLTFRREQAPGHHDLLLDQFHQAGLEPGTVQGVRQWMTAICLAAAGMGFAVVPRSVALRKHDGVVFKPHPTINMSMDLHLLWRVPDPPTTLQPFLDAVRAVAKKKKHG